eukprot:gene13760-5916_t
MSGQAEELYDAIVSQDVIAVRRMCSAKPELLEHCAKFAAAPRMYAQLGYRAAWWLYTPLQYAAFHNKTSSVVEALLELSSDVNNMGALQVSPMHIACANNNVAVIEILLNARRYGCEPPDLDLKDARGRTPNEVAKGDATSVLFANVVVKEVEADDADTEWEMIDIVGLRTTTEHSGGCRCMKCMLDSATAEVLEEEANSTEAPDHVPAAIAKLTPDPADDLIPTPVKPSRWKHDGLTFKLFSKLFSSNGQEESQNDGARARARAASEEADAFADGAMDSPSGFAEYIHASDAASSTADDRSMSMTNQFIDDASIVTFGLVEYDDLHIKRELAKGSYESSGKGVEQSDALVQEIRLFQELKHDHIITFIGACSYGSHFYLCTEFATNGS